MSLIKFTITFNSLNSLLTYILTEIHAFFHHNFFFIL